ncbi:S1 family peptidase [Mycolicibacter senuensis]|uniref:S1 family peptidase n=1 Tax=Mycolicibacter senuensis TaxID=386913 RepID=UPI00256FCAE8|nr:serine protease [Mycolicibacter senuensis]
MARTAHEFFKIPQDPAILSAIGKTADADTTEPLSVADFSKYLDTQGLPAAGNVTDLTGITGAMERAGHLLPFGAPLNLPFMGQRYVTQGGAWGHQIGGNLWLSEVFGAELIIPSYSYVTVQICGKDAKGEPRWGTGLAVNGTHVITNKHVVANLDPTTQVEIHPPQGGSEANRVDCQSPVHLHPELDIAVIEAALPEGKSLRQLPGLAFRNPSWVDDVYLFGYPHIPMTTEMAITVQRGQVVNPAAESPAGAGRPRQKIFLYSAIARPGNSGGPIVAQDGRVIGLVVEDSSPTTSGRAFDHEDAQDCSIEGQIQQLVGEVGELKAKTAAAPFYRGIPASEIVRALDDLGLSGLIELDQPR